MPEINASSEIVVSRRLPVNLLEEDRHFFAKDFSARVPGPDVRMLNDIDVNSEGLLFKNGRLQLESFSQAKSYENWKLRAVLKVHAENLFRRKSRLARAVWVTDDWSSGYFHWLSDVLPKIIIARREIQEYGLLLPHAMKKLNFVEESLSALGLENVQYVPAGETISVDQLHYPVHTHISGDFNETIIREVRAALRDSAASRTSVPRIYISRRKASKRRIVNEKEIEGTLRKFGFALVETEELSFREQVNMFSNCEYLVSLHGAGLMNMLFMPEGGKVLEIRKPDVAVPNCYFNLASALRLPYFYQLCPAFREDEPPHSADLIVDVGRFKNHIEKMLDV